MSCLNRVEFAAIWAAVNCFAAGGAPRTPGGAPGNTPGGAPGGAPGGGPAATPGGGPLGGPGGAAADPGAELDLASRDFAQ